MQAPNTGQEVKESLASRVNVKPADDKTAESSPERLHMIKGASGVYHTAFPRTISPSAPSTVTDPKQIKSFGLVFAASGEASPASPKDNTQHRIDSPAPVTGKTKKKLNLNSLFREAHLSSTPTPASAPSDVPVPAPQTQQQQQPNPSGPEQSSQDGPGIRPAQKQQGSYDSPSMRGIAPLPMISHQPNQTPPSMQQGNGPGSYHFSPPAHLRHSGNGGPGPNPPRSPNFTRAMTNGSMRGPPSTTGSGVLGGPRMGHPSIPPGPAPATPSQTPLTAMPPNMMNVPGSSMPHPQHIGGPLSSVPQGDMPHQMNLPPQMWGYYYPQPHYDPKTQSYYWQPHMPPPHMAPPPHNPQQTPLAMQPSNLPTPIQTPMAMPMSPRVPPIGVQQAAPQTPQSPHPSLPTGNRSRLIEKRPVLIKNSAGEMIDLADLSKKVPPKQEGASAIHSVKKEKTERRPISTRLETTGDSVSGLTEPIALKGDVELEPASTADIAIQHNKLNGKKKKKKKGKSNDVGLINDDDVHVVEHSERAAVSATTNGSVACAASAVMSLAMAKKQIPEYVKELFMLRHLGRAEDYFSTIPPNLRWYLVEELVHRAVAANDLDLDLISEVFAAVAAKSLIDENQFSRGFTTQMECLEDTSECSPNAYNAVARLLRSSKLSQAAVERLTDKMETVVITPKEKLLKKYALFP